jgi:hypothetical protein
LLIKALCLLPFVDQPSVGIKKVRDAIADLKIRGYELGDVVLALGHSRNSEALTVLRKLRLTKSRLNPLGMHGLTRWRLWIPQKQETYC